MTRTLQILTAAATAAVLSVTAVPALAQTATVDPTAENADAADLDMVEERLQRVLFDLKIPDRDMRTVTLDQARRILSVGAAEEQGDAARAQVLAILDE